MKPQDVNLVDYNDVVELYHSESDRAAAILAGSFLEHYLAVFLKEFLIDDPEINDLFNGFGPLSTFSQRITMAAAVGLINPCDRTELRAIKDIRNHFAHNPFGTSFQDDVLDNFFEKLQITHNPQFNVHGEGPLSDRKRIFLLSVSCLVVRMHNAIVLKRHGAPPVSEGFTTLQDSDNVTVDLSNYDKLADSQKN